MLKLELIFNFQIYIQQTQHQINHVRPNTKRQFKKLHSQTFLFLYWKRCFDHQPKFNYQKYSWAT